MLASFHGPKRSFARVINFAIIYLCGKTGQKPCTNIHDDAHHSLPIMCVTPRNSSIPNSN